MKNKILIGTIILVMTTLGSALAWYARGVRDKQAVSVLGESEQRQSVVETIRGEKGEEGDKGDKGDVGSPGQMPAGHWERYCVYPENEEGYRTKGAMIREGSGDCKGGWRTVEMWER